MISNLKTRARECFSYSAVILLSDGELMTRMLLCIISGYRRLISSASTFTWTFCARCSPRDIKWQSDWKLRVGNIFLNLKHKYLLYILLDFLFTGHSLVCEHKYVCERVQVARLRDEKFLNCWLSKSKEKKKKKLSVWFTRSQDSCFYDNVKAIQFLFLCHVFNT